MSRPTVGPGWRGVALGFAIASLAAAVPPTPTPARPSVAPTGSKDGGDELGAARAAITRIRRAYAELPTLRTKVLYVLNSAHKDIDAGTLGLGEMSVSADRAARRLAVSGAAGEIAAISEGTALEVRVPQAPGVVLSLPLANPMSAKPLLDCLRATAKDNLVAAPWLAFELSLYLDGEVGLAAPLDDFRLPAPEDESLVERFRAFAKHQLAGDATANATSWTVLTAGDADGKVVLGMVPETGRVPLVMFVGAGERVGLGPRRVELVLAAKDVSAGGNVESRRNVGDGAEETIESVEEFAARVRRSTLDAIAADIDTWEVELVRIEKTLAELPKDDPNRPFLTESLHQLQHVVGEVRKLQATPAHSAR